MNRKALSFSDVRYAAQGKWRAILPGIGIYIQSESPRVHTPCPGCGGRDRFRFIDKDGLGTWYCGGGGEPCSGDGFALIGHALGISNTEVLKAVAQQLGLSSDMPEKQLRAIKKRAEQQQQEILTKIAVQSERRRLDSNVKNLVCELEQEILNREFLARKAGNTLFPSDAEKEIARDLVVGLKESYKKGTK